MANHAGDESDASAGTRERRGAVGGGESPATDGAPLDEGGSGGTDAPAESDSDGTDAFDWPGWLGRTWYRSKAGIVLVAADVLATAALVGLSVLGSVDPSVDSSRIVPPYVPVFSLLGALGFVFTALIDDFEASVGDVLRYNFRLPAALPLGIGIFLLSDVVLDEAAADDALVLGTVFLSGLYVNLAYKRLGALARRLLPGGGIQGSDGDEGKNDDGDGSDSDGGSDDGSDSDGGNVGGDDDRNDVDGGSDDRTTSDQGPRTAE